MRSTPNRPQAISTPGTHGVECHALTKRFGDVTAVDSLSFAAPMGMVTGFVGANGAGKTTTMRMLLGLAEPTSGSALIGGHRLRDVTQPRRLVGPVLDSPGAHPGQSGRAHLRVQAAAAGIPDSRVDHVLDLVNLTYAANRRSGAYSLGMRQRLSIATAMLGDPEVILFDEPTKGLDPPGIIWLRDFMRDLADEGRCVFVSSHNLGELEAIADRVVMIDRGRLVADATLDDLLTQGASAVMVSTPHAERLAAALTLRGGHVEDVGPEDLRVSRLDSLAIGEIALEERIALRALTDERTDLEVVYQHLTKAQPRGGQS